MPWWTVALAGSGRACSRVAPEDFYTTFIAVVAVILLPVCAAIVLETGEHPPGGQQQKATKPTGDAGETRAPERDVRGRLHPSFTAPAGQVHADPVAR